METKINPVFQVDSPVVKKAYQELDNYLVIEDDDIKSSSKVCAVYFSSNYIYFPNIKSNFEKEIIEKNRFEWWNLRHPKATKHIFVRDIHKQWYLHGINSRVNSLETLSVLLKEKINGFETYFIGSSAGGYAAVLLGSLLQVKRIYTFNNQFFLTDLLDKSEESIDPIVFREQHNHVINKFYNIKPFITKPSIIYYFYSNKSNWDIQQFKEVKELNMNVISVNTSIHGIPLLKNNLTTLFSFSEKELMELTKYKLDPIRTSIKIIGLKSTLIYMLKLVPNAYRRWVYNPIYNITRKKIKE